jgi:hypothetical protein
MNRLLLLLLVLLLQSCAPPDGIAEVDIEVFQTRESKTGYTAHATLEHRYGEYVIKEFRFRNGGRREFNGQEITVDASRDYKQYVIDTHHHGWYIVVPKDIVFE